MEGGSGAAPGRGGGVLPLAAAAPSLMTGNGGLGGGVLGLHIREVKGGSTDPSPRGSFFTSSLIIRFPTSLTTLHPRLSVHTLTLPVKSLRTTHTSPLAVMYEPSLTGTQISLAVVPSEEGAGRGGGGGGGEWFLGGRGG